MDMREGREWVRKSERRGETRGGGRVEVDRRARGKEEGRRGDRRDGKSEEEGRG